MTTSDVQENVFISGTVRLAAAGWWITNSFKLWSIASIIAFFSFFCCNASSNMARNQCSQLIVDDGWNVNPGWQWDGTMSWIKAKASCMYFERSRVPFLKVGYLLLVEILTSLAKKKKKKKVQGESEHRCVNSLWMHWLRLFLALQSVSSKAKSFFFCFLLD